MRLADGAMRLSVSAWRALWGHPAYASRLAGDTLGTMDAPPTTAATTLAPPRPTTTRLRIPVAAPAAAGMTTLHRR